MKNQIIITLGREHGSGGHYIADMIAQELGIKLYDKDSIEKEIVSEGYSGEMIRKMDEKPVNFFASRRIGKYSNSLEVNVAEKTFAMLRDKAANGESFLIIGRCSDQVLKGNPNMLSIFICGNQQAKVGRVMEKKGLSAEEAIEEIKEVDRSRKSYHNYYCETKWGDARGYDMTVKSDVLGFEGTAKNADRLYPQLHGAGLNKNLRPVPQKHLKCSKQFDKINSQRVAFLRKSGCRNAARFFTAKGGRGQLHIQIVQQRCVSPD